MKRRILIVDDTDFYTESIRRMLVFNKNYELEVAYDGLEAKAKLSIFQPDLVILDMMMPGLNGPEVCTYIRHELRNMSTRILLISASIKEEDEKKASELGADDFLAKPFDGWQLKEKIENLLASP